MLRVPAKVRIRVKATMKEILFQEEMKMMSRMPEAMVIIKRSQGRKTSELHQGNFLLPGTKVYFLVIVILVGHMAKDCMTYHKDRHYGPRQCPRSNYARRNNEFLFMNNIECFKRHNVGHMARDCNLTWDPTQARTMPEKRITQVWRRKQIQSEVLLNS